MNYDDDEDNPVDMSDTNFGGMRMENKKKKKDQQEVQ